MTAAKTKDRDSGACIPQVVLRELQGSPKERLRVLEKLYGIKATFGIDLPQLVSLKYNQLESPMGDPLVQQCRGLILDTEDNWAIVARPFDKFFNYGETHAAPLDWKSAVAQEKLDGSLFILYYYKGRWRVGTSGTPDASGYVGYNGKSSQYTFGALFWWIWNVLEYTSPTESWRHVTFLFEMMSPYNRVVCNYQKMRIVFLGCRSSLDGTEFDTMDFPYLPHKWEAARTFPLTTLKEILDTFSTMSPLEQEGYVVVDNNFNRLKIKHPGYVSLHHLRGDGYGIKRILDVVRKGEVKEVLTAFPEWSADFLKVIHAYAALIGELEADYDVIKDLEVQKDFAIEALESRCSGALFALRKGKVKSIKEFVQQMMIDSLMILLEPALRDKLGFGNPQDDQPLREAYSGRV